jgi:gamma-glutamylcysteine synthetase
MKAILELEFPESCSRCSLRFIHTGYDDDEEIGCGYLNTDVTEYTESRHRDCPLKTAYNTGYEDHIRIGNETDAVRLSKKTEKQSA